MGAAAQGDDDMRYFPGIKLSPAVAGFMGVVLIFVVGAVVWFVTRMFSGD